MANWLTQQQQPGLVQPGAGVRATHSSAGLLLRVRHFPSTPPSTLPSCGLLPAQEPQGRHCSPPACTRPGEKASLQRLPSCGLPWNPRGDREQPADVAGLRAEILISSSGCDHRRDLGSSPAQTRSTRPAPTATALRPAPVGHRLEGRGAAHPKGSPGTTSHSHPGKAPRLQPGPAVPGPQLHRHQGEHGSQKAGGGSGGWAVLGSICF